ncbi:branched-chain amino acid ABC transporter permease [Shinella daejeonensis]|uniref:branched-chain amino acid ABC transporter permease n=1 Tax=Shinella daejeonensis TaxID=659017 RepID=UPI0020C757FB|nr:branched-chain amino acid ABC transporter permease [Shinella daejeonensis]MCP8895265.1 branched-chain amino acid ABC transporter permease [Shinella daejeonensis]
MGYFLQVVIDAVSLGSLFALVSLSIGLIFGIMRLINFAQGDFVTIGAYSLLAPAAGAAPVLFLGALPWPLMIVLVLAVVVVLALVTERVAFRPLRNAEPATLLVSSFAVSYFLQNLVIVLYTSRPKALSLGTEISTVVDIFGLRIASIQLLTIVVTITLLVAISAFLRFTPLGLQMRASAENFRMARLLGVRANRVIAGAFAIAGFLGGVVALLLTAQTGVIDVRAGATLAVFGFFATVIGGMGSLVGAALGGFLVGAVSAVLQTILPADVRPFRDAVVFAAVIVVLLVRPRGIIASKSKERV